jgi:Uncharacterized protein conserved in bacteria
LYGRIAGWAKNVRIEASRWRAAATAGDGNDRDFQGRFQRNGAPVVSDGPFIEGKEIIGGYWIIDVADLDEALEMAKEWPASTMVEVRPILERTD